MSQRRGHKKITLLTVLCMAVCFIAAPLVAAIATGYLTADTGLQTGMAASLVDNGSTEASVERTTQTNYNNFVGIVTTIDASLISVGSGSSKVFVENDGQVQAYVSDINGVVKEGDLLVVSPLKGVLMRQNGSSTVIGAAAGGPEQTAAYSYEENGETKETQIAKLQVNLNHPGEKAGSGSSNSPLAKLGRALVGKDVSETRVVIALIIFVIVMIAEGSIIYGAVSSAITALGRNPMAKKVIQGEFIRVAVVAILVLVVGLGAVYVVLWL